MMLQLACFFPWQLESTRIYIDQVTSYMHHRYKAAADDGWII